jgi:hypothetical protein
VVTEQLVMFVVLGQILVQVVVAEGYFQELAAQVI